MVHMGSKVGSQALPTTQLGPVSANPLTNRSFFFSETESHYGVEAGCELEVTLLQLLECWFYRCVPLYLVLLFFSSSAVLP